MTSARVSKAAPNNERAHTGTPGGQLNHDLAKKTKHAQECGEETARERQASARAAAERLRRAQARARRVQPRGRKREIEQIREDLESEEEE
jgi:ribosomal protein L34E